jgi:hypothetical protein
MMRRKNVHGKLLSLKDAAAADLGVYPATSSPDTMNQRRHK